MYTHDDADVYNTYVVVFAPTNIPLSDWLCVQLFDWVAVCNIIMRKHAYI